MRNDDESSEQRTDCAATVSANLKDGLCEAVTSAGGETRDARGFGVKHRRSRADEAAATNTVG